MHAPGRRWQAIVVLLLIATPAVSLAQDERETAAPAGMTDSSHELAAVFELLHHAGNSCYTLANGLLGDEERVHRGDGLVADYLARQESAVSICRNTCSEA